MANGRTMNGIGKALTYHEVIGNDTLAPKVHYHDLESHLIERVTHYYPPQYVEVMKYWLGLDGYPILNDKEVAEIIGRSYQRVGAIKKVLTPFIQAIAERYR